ARVLGHVLQDDLIVWRDHHRAAELRRVADRAALKLAGTQRRRSALREDLGAEQVVHRADLRARGLVAASAFVSENREGDVLAPAEVRGVARGELTDQARRRP